MFSLGTIAHVTAAVLATGALTFSVASADSLTIVNPDFSAFAVLCSGGRAYQSEGGGCDSSNGPQQHFDSDAGIGWIFAPHTLVNGGDGITGPDTAFNPPPFTGMPFSQAALLQTQGVIFQKISGFAAGQIYKLTFYLGSRYADGCCEGNQTVLATLDGNVIGLWKLVSFTPFTLRTAIFKVATGGSHILGFTGTSQADNTAFFSGASIETVNK